MTRIDFLRQSNHVAQTTNHAVDAPKRHASYEPLVAKQHRALRPPPLLKRSHELVGARVPSRHGPLVDCHRSQFRPFKFQLQVLHSSVLCDLLAKRPLLLLGAEKAKQKCENQAYMYMLGIT